jgi:hypothetical protein
MVAQGAKPVNIQNTIMATPSSGHQKASGAVRMNQRYLRLSGGAKCRIPKNETNHNAAGPKGAANRVSL